MDSDIKLRLQLLESWVSFVWLVLSPVSIFPVIGRRMRNNGHIVGDLFSTATFHAIIKLSDTLRTMFV